MSQLQYTCSFDALLILYSACMTLMGCSQKYWTKKPKISPGRFLNGKSGHRGKNRHTVVALLNVDVKEREQACSTGRRPSDFPFHPFEFCNMEIQATLYVDTGPCHLMSGMLRMTACCGFSCVVKVHMFPCLDTRTQTHSECTESSSLIFFFK